MFLLLLEIEERCLIVWLKFFLAKIFDKIFKIQLFLSKRAQIMLFRSTLLKFARPIDLETLTQTPWSPKEQ